MKYIVIINKLSIGGAERLAVDEVNELTRRGIETFLVTLGRENRHSYESQLLPEVKRICITFRSLCDFYTLFRLTRFLRQEKPDAVVTHLWFANTIGRISARLAGIQQVFSFEHNIYDKVKSRKQFLLDRLLQVLSTRIIAVSEAVRSSLINHGIAPEKIALVSNGIDLSKYSGGMRDKLRKSLGLGVEFTYLFIGRLIDQKGVDVLLNAFAQVPSGVLLLAGEGALHDSLKKLTRALTLERRVVFLGYRDDIPALLSAVDCFVLPSRYEGLGIVVLEALAAGKPIVVSDFGSAREMIANNDNGIVVPIENPKMLASALSSIQNDLLLRKRLSRRAKESAAKFSIQSHVDALLRAVRI